MGCCVTTTEKPPRKTIMLKKPSMTRENGELHEAHEEGKLPFIKVSFD